MTKQAGGAGATAVAIGLLQVNGAQLIGCFLGLAATGLLMSDAISRAQKTDGDPREFPGPRTWPVTATLIDFFMLNVFLQAAREMVF